MTNSSQKVVGVIPARYRSTRFEGKPLAEIKDGKSMIRMVYEACRKSRRLDRVVVATDDQRIYGHVLDFGGEVVMTSEELATGTDRCLAAIQDVSCDIVVNIQGDEPLIDPAVIDEVVTALENSPNAVCATPVCLIHEEDEVASQNTVKAVMNLKREAIYFSRSVIPFKRGKTSGYYKHIGLYAYRKKFLEKFVLFPQSSLEISESLEQLRIIENGYTIQCVVVEYNSVGVDTPLDLKRVQDILKGS